ncbi:MAG: hypothetical protein COA88_11240 [Kordia sp.]|nr:MAG: hypothetical protein COA88_11240 [Kordia sp.]
MKTLLFSLFLCLTFFTTQAQINSKTSDATLLVNGNECNKCSLELTREGLKKMTLATNSESVKIVSFKLKVPGCPTIHVYGHKFNHRGLSALKKASIGSRIAIFGIDTNKGVIKTSVRVTLK